MSSLALTTLMNWLGGMMWSLGRVGGFCMVAPVF